MESQEKRNELIQNIFRSQHCIGHFMQSDKPDVWLALNLTIAQLKSLMFIFHEGVSNFKQLAEALKVSPPNVTGIIDRMVEQGLVSREDNPQNRRMQMLKVTEKGASIIRDLHERGTAHLTGILDSLNLEELAALSKGLAALARAAELHHRNQTESKC